MAAFSYPFLLDSVFMSNTSIKMSGFMEEPNNTSTNCISQFYQPDSLQDKTSCLERSTKVYISNNDPSVTNKHSTCSSFMVDKPESGEQVTQKLTRMGKKRRYPVISSLCSAQSKDAIRELKGKKQKILRNSGMKECEEKKQRVNKKDQKNVPEEAPTGYIHVRARRGQATDSHSLAERARTAKISERMKLLQAIVPGCDKVTGKAMMLDEIINYVQSLKCQVEFLSMKLASSNPMLYDFGMDLDALMVRPESLSSLASPLPNVLQCSSTESPALSLTTNIFSSPANNHPLMDSTLLFQEGLLLPNNLSQANGQLLWDVDGQRQKFINQSGFNDNLCSLH